MPLVRVMYLPFQTTYFSNFWYNFHQFPHPNIGRPTENSECFGGQFTTSEQSKHFGFDNFPRFCQFRALVVMKPIIWFEKEGDSTPRQFHRVVTQWEGPVGGKGMPPFYILLPQTLPMESRPRPGPGDTRCTGEERLPAIQTLGRVMRPSSHAWQSSQVCQCSLSPSWPRCSRSWAMPMPAWLRSLQHGKRSCGARLEIWRTLTNSTSTSRRC